MNEKEFLVQKIRTQYTEKENTELDALKALDRKVKRPANIFAYVFGSLGAVVMGSGMSLVMTDIGSYIGLTETGTAMTSGIITGIIGMGLALLTYPIYKAILNARKQKHAAGIIELSDKIMNK